MRLEERRDQWLKTHKGGWISHSITLTGMHQVVLNWREMGGTPERPVPVPHQLVADR